MDYLIEQKKINESIERAKNTIEWHRDRIKNTKEELTSLEKKRDRLAAVNELKLVLHHLGEFFQYTKMTDLNPQTEFLRFIGNILAVKVGNEIEEIVKMIPEKES